MANPFGPQTSDASLTLPPNVAKNRFGAVDTWCKPCSPDGSGGTQLNEAFFNILIGNLNKVVNEAGVPAPQGDMTTLYRSLLKIIDGRSGTVEITGLFGTAIGTFRSLS